MTIRPLIDGPVRQAATTRRADWRDPMVPHGQPAPNGNAGGPQALVATATFANLLETERTHGARPVSAPATQRYLSAQMAVDLASAEEADTEPIHAEMQLVLASDPGADRKYAGLIALLGQPVATPI